MSRLIKFIDWLKEHDATFFEKNSEARRKREILMGNQPPQPDATMLGGSQTLPWYKQFKAGTAYKAKKIASDKCLRKKGL